MKGRDHMLIYVCSPYAGDVQKNIENAKKFCLSVCDQGHIPYAPHLFFTQFFNDTIPEERKKGLGMGLYMLGVCEELWVFVVDGRISGGMAAEIEEMKRLQKPIRYIQTHGGY